MSFGEAAEQVATTASGMRRRSLRKSAESSNIGAAGGSGHVTRRTGDVGGGGPVSSGVDPLGPVAEGNGNPNGNLGSEEAASASAAKRKRVEAPVLIEEEAPSMPPKAFRKRQKVSFAMHPQEGTSDQSMYMRRAGVHMECSSRCPSASGSGSTIATSPNDHNSTAYAHTHTTWPNDNPKNAAADPTPGLSVVTSWKSFAELLRDSAPPIPSVNPELCSASTSPSLSGGGEFDDQSNTTLDGTSSLGTPNDLSPHSSGGFPRKSTAPWPALPMGYTMDPVPPPSETAGSELGRDDEGLYGDGRLITAGSGLFGGADRLYGVGASSSSNIKLPPTSTRTDALPNSKRKRKAKGATKDTKATAPAGGGRGARSMLREALVVEDAENKGVFGPPVFLLPPMQAVLASGTVKPANATNGVGVEKQAKRKGGRKGKLEAVVNSDAVVASSASDVQSGTASNGVLTQSMVLKKKDKAKVKADAADVIDVDDRDLQQEINETTEALATHKRRGGRLKKETPGALVSGSVPGEGVIDFSGASPSKEGAQAPAKRRGRPKRDPVSLPDVSEILDLEPKPLPKDDLSKCNQTWKVVANLLPAALAKQGDAGLDPLARDSAVADSSTETDQGLPSMVEDSPAAIKEPEKEVLEPRVWCSSKPDFYAAIPELAPSKAVGGVHWTNCETVIIILDDTPKFASSVRPVELVPVEVDKDGVDTNPSANGTEESKDERGESYEVIFDLYMTRALVPTTTKGAKNLAPVVDPKGDDGAEVAVTAQLGGVGISAGNGAHAPADINGVEGIVNPSTNEVFGLHQPRNAENATADPSSVSGAQWGGASMGLDCLPLHSREAPLMAVAGVHDSFGVPSQVGEPTFIDAMDLEPVVKVAEHAFPVDDPPLTAKKTRRRKGLYDNPNPRRSQRFSSNQFRSQGSSPSNAIVVKPDPEDDMTHLLLFQADSASTHNGPQHAESSRSDANGGPSSDKNVDYGGTSISTAARTSNAQPGTRPRPDLPPLDTSRDVTVIDLTRSLSPLTPLPRSANGNGNTQVNGNCNGFESPLTPMAGDEFPSYWVINVDSPLAPTASDREFMGGDSKARIQLLEGTADAGESTDVNANGTSSMSASAKTAKTGKQAGKKKRGGGKSKEEAVEPAEPRVIRKRCRPPKGQMPTRISKRIKVMHEYEEGEVRIKQEEQEDMGMGPGLFGQCFVKVEEMERDFGFGFGLGQELLGGEAAYNDAAQYVFPQMLSGIADGGAMDMGTGPTASQPSPSNPIHMSPNGGTREAAAPESKFVDGSDGPVVPGSVVNVNIDEKNNEMSVLQDANVAGEPDTQEATPPFSLPSLPTEVRAIIDSFIQDTPVSLIASYDRISELVPEESKPSLSKGFGFAYLGFFKVLGFEERPVVLDVNASQHLTVEWKFRVQWKVGGEFIVQNGRNISHPWWVRPKVAPGTSDAEGSSNLPVLEMSPPEASEHVAVRKPPLIGLETPSLYLQAKMSHPNYRVRDLQHWDIYFSLVPHSMLVGLNSFIPDDAFPTGWFCQLCGNVNFQVAMRHRKCSNAVCKGKMDSYFRELSDIRGPHGASPLCLPFNNHARPRVKAISTVWKNGMKTFSYYFDGDTKKVWAKHVFTSNAARFQKVATDLLIDVQLNAQLKRVVGDSSGPYFTSTFHVPELPIPGLNGTVPTSAHLNTPPTSVQAQPAVVPECINRARNLLSTRSIHYAEIADELAKVTRLDVMGWITAGSRKNHEVLRTKERVVMVLCLGCDVVINLAPAEDKMKAKKVGATIKIVKAKRGKQTQKKGKGKEQAKPPVDSKGVKTLDESSSVGAKLEPVTGDGTETPQQEQDSPNDAQLPVATAVSETLPVAVPPSRNVQLTMVHGDLVAVYGGDFEYSLKRTGPSILVFGSSAP